MNVSIVKDSISEAGVRITTFHLRYWRAIHSELMTHRVFSRNARSSRAVPVATLLSEDKFIPQFGLNKPGMQSTETPSPELQAKWEKEWNELSDITREYVKAWGEEGMHKQHANRPLEWFGWIDVLVTSTYWDNFYGLRIDSYAQPEFEELATLMRAEQKGSHPQLLKPGQWHLPYITEDDFNLYQLEQLQKLSTARCARLSYRPFDGQDSYEAEMSRYERLVVSQPVHASPAEHQATPLTQGQEGNTGNFHGWVQYRKLLDDEAIMEN